MAAESLFLQAPISSGLPRPGARRNRVPNPSYEYGVEGWTTGAFYHLNAGATIVQAVPALPQSGDSVGAITCDGVSAAQGAFHSLAGQTFTAGVTYYLRARVYQGVPSPVPIQLMIGRAGADHAVTTVTNNWSGWSDVTVSWTPASTVSDAWCGIRTSLGSPAAATTIYVDSWICEHQPIGTYFDGSTPGFEWESAPGASTSGTSPTLSITDGVAWTLEEFNLDNPVPRDVFVSDSDRDGSRPMAMPRYDNRQPSFGIRLKTQADADTMLAKIGELEAFLSQARRIAQDHPVDPADYCRLVWTPQDSTKTFFLPIYAGRIAEIPKDNGEGIGWILRTPKLTVELTTDPAGYGTWTSFKDSAAISTPNFISSVTVPPPAGDLPPWAKVTLTDSTGIDYGLVRVGVKQNEASALTQIDYSALVTAGYDSSVSGGAINFGVWAGGQFRALAATPLQSRTGRFRVYLVATTANAGAKIRFSYASKGGSRKVLPAVDASNAYGFRDVYLGDITVDGSWTGWLEGNGISGKAYGIVLLPIDSLVEAVEPAAGENLAGATVQLDEFGTGAAHLSGKSLDVGTGTWALSGTNIASPTWPVSSSMAWRQVVSNTAPAFARAGSNNVLDGSYKARLLLTYTALFTETQDRPHIGVFARYSSITNFLVAGYSLSSPSGSGSVITPGVWMNVGGTYYPLWKGVGTDVAPTNGGLFDVELQTASDGRWWAKFQQIGLDNVTILSSQEGYGSHGILRSGGTLGGATVGHGLFDWKQTSSAFTRVWQDYRQRTLVGLTPLPLQANKDLAWNDAVLLADAGSGEYPYAGASGLELQPGVNNNLSVMVRRNSVAAQDTGDWANPAVSLKVEGYPRYLTVPR